MSLQSYKGQEMLEDAQKANAEITEGDDKYLVVSDPSGIDWNIGN